MLSPIIYHTLLIAVCAYAFLHGQRDERLAAIVCVVATLATRLALSPLTVRYSSVEMGVFLVDLFALAGFIFIALRTDRFWPHVGGRAPANDHGGARHEGYRGRPHAAGLRRRRTFLGLSYLPNHRHRHVAESSPRTAGLPHARLP